MRKRRMMTRRRRRRKRRDAGRGPKGTEEDFCPRVSYRSATYEGEGERRSGRRRRAAKLAATASTADRGGYPAHLVWEGRGNSLATPTHSHTSDSSAADAGSARPQKCQRAPPQLLWQTLHRERRDYPSACATLGAAFLGHYTRRAGRSSFLWPFGQRLRQMQHPDTGGKRHGLPYTTGGR